MASSTASPSRLRSGLRQSPPLHLTIRFTTSDPDLSLTIPFPSTVTALLLKQQIRAALHPPFTSSDTADRNLRLIHAGKVLLDSATLYSALRLSSIALFSPPSRPSPPPRLDVKGKGKAKATDDAAEPLLAPELESPRIYINCSVGDLLTAQQLAEEAAAAEQARLVLSSSKDSPDAAALQYQQGSHTATPSPDRATTPPPRGFDRLLTAGFTPAEVTSLRAQFTALQAGAHTPDTMPSQEQLRTLEEQWLDEGGSANTMGGMDGMGAGGGFGDGSAGAVYADILWGNVLGFFWPIGGLVWLCREEGVWSTRRQMGVFTGMMVNIAFSVLRVTS